MAGGGRSIATTAEKGMLARYRMIRGQRPSDDPLPAGIRQDTRWRTSHCLRPTQELVEAFLADSTEEAWQRFASGYYKLLEARFRADREPFDALAKAATELEVFLGCSCPTKNNPDVNHCHTVLALHFMKAKYRSLDVWFPG